MQRVLDTLNTSFHAIQTPALCQQQRHYHGHQGYADTNYGDRFGAHVVTCAAFGPGIVLRGLIPSDPPDGRPRRRGYRR